MRIAIFVAVISSLFLSDIVCCFFCPLLIRPLQHQVDAQRLAGVSMVILKNGAPVDHFCTGLANLQTGEALRPDHIHRAFSNTKLMTSVLVLMLADQGRFALDDPIKTWILSLEHPQVRK